MAFWLKGNPRAAQSRRLPRTRFQRAWEALEDRVVPSFAAPVSYNVGTQTTQGFNGFGPQVITGDFYGDGNLDLAVTNTADGTVSILRGNGNGTFQPAVSYSTGLGAGNPVWLAAADFNGDGKLDLAVQGNNSEVSLLLNNGNGTFAPARTYAVGSGDRGGLAVGDFFGNGRQDIAVADFGSNNVEILPNNGNGTFGTPDVLAMPTGFSHIRSIATGNLFGNGYADLVVAGGEGYNNALLSTDPAGVALFKNDGQGHFTYEGEVLAAVTPDPGGGNGQGDTVNPEHVNVADLNNDGKPDLVLSLYDHNIDVFLNNGNGTFQPAVAYTTETPGAVGGYPRGVAFGDFNGDGKVDIATLNFGEPKPADQPTPEPGSVGILYGNGDGTFQAPIQYTPYTLPGGLAVGDFNGDGLPDLAVTQNYTGHSVSVMRNQPNTAEQAPTVTSVAPATGPTTGGTQVTITGTNFLGTSQVDFGSVAATSFTVNSNTSITATAPAEAAGTVDVTVYNAGASATSAADNYTFQNALATETWTGLGTTSNWSDPANWSANAVPAAGTTVIFDGTSAKNTVVDPTFAGTVAAVQIKSGYVGTVTLNEGLTVTGAFTQQAGTYNANGSATSVTGLTTVSGGTYLAAANTQTLTGGLTVSGGTFTGSTGTVTTANVTLSSGTLNAPSGSLVVTGGNLYDTGGTFNADLGTVTYTGTNVAPTVSVGTGLIAFYNFTDALTATNFTSTHALTINGTLTVTGTFAWKNNANPIYGNIEAQGNVDGENHGGIGNPYVTLDGTGNQTIEDLSGGGGGQFRTITINKPSGTVTLACNPIVFSTLTLSAGTVNTGSFSWLVGGQGPVSAAPGLNLGNLEVDGANVTVSSANLQVANLTFAAASDKLTAPTGNLSVAGNWTNSVGATFTPNGGTVVFDGAGGTQLLTSGGKAFNNLTILAGATVKLADNLTVTGVFTNHGTLIPYGPPTVTGVAPASGPTSGGTQVTITGTNFYGATQVEFGSIAATSFTVKSNTSITATAPAEAAGTVNVTVYNAGTSATSAADQFTFAATSQGPAVTGVTPATGSTSGGTAVTIAGTNFTSASAVAFGGVSASSFTVNSATSITARAPAEAAGTVDITVTTATATSTASAADHYTYQSPSLATIAVTPGTASVMDGSTQPFSATAYDQFGNALSPQPAFTWSVTGLGSIQSNGLYNAPTSGTGTASVTAASGSVNGTASVTVTLPADTWTGLGTTSNWSDPANWSAHAAPAAGTTVIFDATSAKNAVVDPAFAGTVAAVQIKSGYAGTVTLAEGLTVTGAFTQQAGTYNANGSATSVTGLTTVSGGTYLAAANTQTLTGGLTVSGGTFTGSTGTVTTANVTLSSGTLNAPSGALVVTGGNFTYTAGTFNADLGTVTYTGTNVAPTVSVGTGLIAFYNFTDALTATTFTSTHALTINGTLTVAGTFAWKNNANPIYGNIEAQGNVDGENHGGIGNPYVTLDGTGNQTIEDLSGGGGGQFRTITINKPSGTVTLACNPIVFSTLTLSAGTVNTGSFSWLVGGQGPVSAAPGLNLGNLEVDGANVTVSSANLQVANLTFAAASDKLTAPSGNLSVAGNWTNSVGAAFTPNGGTVVFDGAGGTQLLTSGGKAFNNLTILAGATVKLEANVTVIGTFLNDGTLIANGFTVN